eukprot:4792105-Amphidinium_carterae.1
MVPAFPSGSHLSGSELAGMSIHRNMRFVRPSGKDRNERLPGVTSTAMIRVCAKQIQGASVFIDAESTWLSLGSTTRGTLSGPSAAGATADGPKADHINFPIAQLVSMKYQNGSQQELALTCLSSRLN